jgi:hypothetical protein
MGTYTYNPEQTESPNQLVPEGDYVFQVTDAREEISQGKSTSGSTVYKLRLQCSGAGGKTMVFEDLIDHDKTAWKINGMIKATGMFAAGGRVMLDAESFIGLRGYCHLIQDTYNDKTRNKVGHYITDRPLLPRIMPVAAPEPSDPFAS